MPYKDPAVQREYQRRWAANNRAEFLADKSCCRCGTTTELEVDHIDPSQKIDHRVWSWSHERRKAELAKCQVLCNGCHLDKTIEYRVGHLPNQHGTQSMYNGGCRCVPCAQVNAAKCSAYRLRG